MKYTAILIGLVLMGLMVSCTDPEPGEISVRCLKNGKQQNCTVELWTTGENSKQITEGAGANGLTYLKNVVPNDYILKFRDYDDTYYPAEVPVKLPNAGSEFYEVELTKDNGIAEG